MIELKNWMRLAMFDLDEAVREMSRNILSHRHRRREDRIDQLLVNMDLTLFPERFLIAVLIATAGCDRDLKARDEFRERVYAHIVRGSKDESYAREQLLGL